jgi:hypothetical protein
LLPLYKSTCLIKSKKHFEVDCKIHRPCLPETQTGGIKVIINGVYTISFLVALVHFWVLHRKCYTATCSDPYWIDFTAHELSLYVLE